MSDEAKRARQRLADILAGGLLAALWFTTGGDTPRTHSIEEALEALEGVVDDQTKQLVTSYMRRRLRSLKGALEQIAEGDDPASFEARRALEELKR